MSIKSDLPPVIENFIQMRQYRSNDMLFIKDYGKLNSPNPVFTNYIFTANKKDQSKFCFEAKLCACLGCYMIVLNL